MGKYGADRRDARKYRCAVVLRANGRSSVVAERWGNGEKATNATGKRETKREIREGSVKDGNGLRREKVEPLPQRKRLPMRGAGA
ncbi:hypothetical protein MRX96_023528 [Rhipicephalus microplus]